MWDLLRAETEPVPPALADGFLTTGPLREVLLFLTLDRVATPFSLLSQVLMHICMTELVTSG